MPQGERLCGSSRAGTGAAASEAGNPVAPGSGRATLGSSLGGGVRAGEAGAEDAAAEELGAEEVDAEELGAVAADGAGVAAGARADGAGAVKVEETGTAGGDEAGGATAPCCAGAADCANPEAELARNPTRHMPAAESFNRNATFRRSLTERIIPVLGCVALEKRRIS